MLYPELAQFPVTTIILKEQKRKVSEKEMAKRLANRKASALKFARVAWDLIVGFRKAWDMGLTFETHISRKNDKIGNIYNVSIPPLISCGRSCWVTKCALYCYARRTAVRRGYNSDTMLNWCCNLVKYEKDPDGYFADITEAMRKAAKTKLPYFRYHVGGEIPDYEYLLRMVKASVDVPGCTSLCFTTRNDLVAKYKRENGEFPVNLRMVLSCGADGEQPTPTFICPGKCDGCHFCWNAKPGDVIGFKEH